MAVLYQIANYDKGLMIRVERKHSLVQGVLAAFASGSVAALLAARFLSIPWTVVITLAAALVAYVGAMREHTVELQVSNLELQTRGYFGGNFRSKRSVSSADVRWLEYREQAGGGDVPNEPGGLYAVLKSGDACVLPYVNEQQVGEIIDAISKRFPDFAKQWHAESPFGDHFTTLGGKSG